MWFTFYESGVHATLAGVALGLLAPSRPFLAEVDADRIADELSADQAVTAAEVRDISFRIRESVPVTERLEDLLHPWTSYLVVPLFALANAGIVLSGDGTARRPRVAGHPRRGRRAWWSGKLVGVDRRHRPGACASGSGGCPTACRSAHVVGMAAIAGIGFTVSIFVGGLAFDDPALADQATLGVLLASVVAAVLGAAILRRAD